MKVKGDVEALMIRAGILPEVMPNNFTFNKVREVLGELETAHTDAVREAADVAQSLKIRGPLQSLIFIKHHLGGLHEAEVDRIEESKEGAKYAVLVYPEGELPIPLEHLPAGVEAGVRLIYDPALGRYSRKD